MRFVYRQNLNLMSRPRVILHIDLDCFYAQVESIRLGIPQDEPLAVQQWGSLLAVNYAARKFNIKRSNIINKRLDVLGF